jgi:hypothetical protein
MDTTQVGSVQWDLHLNKAGFNREMSALGSTTKSAFSKMAQTAATVFSVYAIGKFIKSSIDLASNLNEVQNVVDTTFGQSSIRINEFAKTAARSYGLSEYAAKKYTGVAGSMYKSMGFGADAAASMSIEMAKLAGDFASFYNLDADAAFEKIRSGISGETEPLKQLGINLSVANLEAFALKKGITQSYNSMNQQNQALLRYNYLLETSKDAQGDFSKTSGSWANQTRILKLQWDSLKSSMGQAFIALLQPILTMINTMIPKLTELANGFSAFMASITGNQPNTASASIAAIGTASSASASATDKAAKAMKRSLAGFDELNVISKKSTTGTGGTGSTAPTTSSDSSAATAQAQAQVNGFTTFFQEKGAMIMSIIGGITAAVTFFFVAMNWTAIIAPIAAAIGWVSNFLIVAGNLGFLNTVVLGLGSAFGTAFLPIAGIAAAIGLVVAALIQLWTTNDGFKEAVTGAWNGIMDSLNLVWTSTLQPIFNSFTTMLQDIWTNGLQPLWNSFVGFVEQIVLLGVDIINAFKPVYDWFVITFGPIIAAVWDVLFKNIGNAINFGLGIFKIFFDYISGVISSIRTIFGGLATFISGVFSGNWKKAWDGIKTIFQGIWDGIKNYLVTIINMMISGINFMIKSALVPVNALIKGWNNTIGKVTGKISEVNIEIPAIKAFKNGGVLDSPTLGLMGEYPGASSNKEIVTPEKLMAEVFAEVLKGFFETQQGGDIIIQNFMDSELIEEVISKKSTLKLQAANGRG